MLKPSDLKPWAKIATGDRTQNARAVRALVERVRHLDQRKPDTKQSAYFDASRGPGFIHCRFFLSEALQVLLRRKLPLEGTDLVDIGAMMASAIHGIATRGNPLEEWLRVYDNFASGNDVDDRLGAVVRTLADALSKETYPKETVVLASEYLKRARSISPEATSASGAGKYTKIKLSLLEPSEVGSSTTLLELKMGLGILPKRELVLEPIGPDHAMLPADCPLKEEHELISRLMSDVVGTRQYSEPDLSAHASSVIGLCAASCYRKIPGVGPRAVKVANACVYSLSQTGNETAVGQLAVLKVRVKFGTAQKEIEKALNAAAAKLGLPRDQIEEMGVPAYGLEEVGRREETFGQYRAEICANGPSDVAVRWFDETGNALKSVPAKVKAEFKDELKELQQAAKDIAAMLPAQRDRIDSLFLAQKQWTVEQWRQRYIDHPLVGVIGRKLIWQFEEKGKKPVVGIYVGSALRTDSPARAKAVREADPAKAEVGSGTDSINRAKAVRSADPTGDGIFVDSSGKEIQIPQSATVQLWHPIGKPIDEILRWRSFLEQKQIVQPFKQAHREVYLLTDAERNTRTCSNRYTAHILRQH